MRTITAVLHQSVKGANKSIKEIAFELGKPYHTLMAELSAQSGHKLGIEFLVPLMQATHDYRAMDYLARETGGVYFRLTEAECTNTEFHKSMLSSVKEFGEFAAECANNIADGLICHADIMRIEKEGQEAINAISQLMRTAKDLHEEQYGIKKALKSDQTF